MSVDQGTRQHNYIEDCERRTTVLIPLVSPFKQSAFRGRNSNNVFSTSCSGVICLGHSYSWAKVYRKSRLRMFTVPLGKCWRSASRSLRSRCVWKVITSATHSPTITSPILFDH